MCMSARCCERFWFVFVHDGAAACAPSEAKAAAAAPMAWVSLALPPVGTWPASSARTYAGLVFQSAPSCGSNMAVGKHSPQVCVTASDEKFAAISTRCAWVASQYHRVPRKY